MALAALTCLLGAAAMLRQLRSWLRWPAALAAMVTLGAFSLDWATGERGFAPLATLFLGLAIDRAGPDRTLVTAVGVPVFAIAALLWHAVSPRGRARARDRSSS